MKINLPAIVYFQTRTECNGHCSYCPFDDIYLRGNFPHVDMSFKIYREIIEWLVGQNYEGRLGFLLHYEPTLDNRLVGWIKWTRNKLPKVKIEIATNGIIKNSLLDIVDEVVCVPIEEQTRCTSRAGNARACEKTTQGISFSEHPCSLPKDTMCIAATGQLLLCCQDWRHEAVVGDYTDLSLARLVQLSIDTKKVEMCNDCMQGKTAEAIGNRLGKRKL